MPAGRPPEEKTLSIRLVWPFARITVRDARAMSALARSGISPEVFGNPDARVPYRALMDLLTLTVTKTGDATLGLRAGDLIEPGDFDVLEYAARSAPSLGEAIRIMSRYFRLMNDAAEVTLVEEGDVAIWRYRNVGGYPAPAASNDFVVSAALAFSRRNATEYEPPLEIHFSHPKPAYVEEYRRFGAGKLVFDHPNNELVIRRARLAVPMLRANPELAAAFQLRAQQLVSQLEAQNGIASRVREEVYSQLGSGTATMDATARRLAMSVATLRRRLQDEGTTFSDIVDDLRKRLAEQYLSQSVPAVSEIAFLLGFADVASFDRAFKRWMGVSPTKYRAQVRRPS